jgi:hypothetical protein
VVDVEHARVRIAGVTLSAESGTVRGDCVRVVGDDARLTIVDSVVGPCEGTAVDAGAGAQLTLQRVRVEHAVDGGLQIGTGVFDLDSVVVVHVGPDNHAAVQFTAPPVPGARARHLRVAANPTRGTFGGIDCRVAVDLHATIVWGNEAAAASPLCRFFDSDVQGGAAAGVGNINADPLFVDLVAGDVHLAAGSPCIDAAPLSDARRDIDGALRTGVRDIGADER